MGLFAKTIATYHLNKICTGIQIQFECFRFCFCSN